MRKERKHYTAKEKVAILRRHLLDQVPVSDLCEENGLQPTVFYRWLSCFLNNFRCAMREVLKMKSCDRAFYSLLRTLR
jgi:transposase